jgi:hypothetical protein
MDISSLRANGSRECAPDDRLREAIHGAAEELWIASSLTLLAMTWNYCSCASIDMRERLGASPVAHGNPQHFLHHFR